MCSSLALPRCKLCLHYVSSAINWITAFLVVMLGYELSKNYVLNVSLYLWAWELYSTLPKTQSALTTDSSQAILNMSDFFAH